MDDKPSYFSILTAVVRYHEDLNAFEKLLFSEVTALSNKFGYCSALNDYFAKVYKCSERTISRRLNVLVKHGLIRVEMRFAEGTKQIIGRKMWPIADGVPIDKSVYTSRQKCRDPIDKNGVDNKTSINNTSKKKKQTKKKSEIEINIPENLNLNAWKLWLLFKKQLKDEYKTPLGKQTKANQLAEIPEKNQMMCVIDSIGNEWKGLFPKNHTGKTYYDNRKLTRAEQTLQDIRKNFGVDLEHHGIEIPELERDVRQPNLF